MNHRTKERVFPLCSTEGLTIIDPPTPTEHGRIESAKQQRSTGKRAMSPTASTTSDEEVISSLSKHDTEKPALVPITIYVPDSNVTTSIKQHDTTKQALVPMTIYVPDAEAFSNITKHTKSTTPETYNGAQKQDMAEAPIDGSDEDDMPASSDKIQARDEKQNGVAEIDVKKDPIAGWVFANLDVCIIDVARAFKVHTGVDFDRRILQGAMEAKLTRDVKRAYDYEPFKAYVEALKAEPGFASPNFDRFETTRQADMDNQMDNLDLALHILSREKKYTTVRRSLFIACLSLTRHPQIAPYEWSEERRQQFYKAQIEKALNDIEENFNKELSAQIPRWWIREE